MTSLVRFLTRRRGGKGWHWTDVVAYVWLASGLLLLFGPVVWLVLSSFKTPAGLAEFPRHSFHPIRGLPSSKAMTRPCRSTL